MTTPIQPVVPAVRTQPPAPGSRRDQNMGRVRRLLQRFRNGLRHDEIAAHLGLSAPAVGRALEDLRYHGGWVLSIPAPKNGYRVVLGAQRRETQAGEVNQAKHLATREARTASRYDSIAGELNDPAAVALYQMAALQHRAAAASDALLITGIEGLKLNGARP